MMELQESYMIKTIELALKGSGWVNPEPLSGALLVKDERIIGGSFHNKDNKSISVTVLAIQSAKEDTSGSELYLNIEPKLESFERDDFIKVFKKNKISKVYIGMENPNKTSKGKTIALLSSLGITVEVGVLEEKCQQLNEIYTHYTTYGTPFVFVKWAMTLDGKLACKTGDSKWISGDESLDFVHHLRQRVAAILVGEGTVKLDNPALTTRLKGCEISNPIRLILSKYGNIDPKAKVLEVDENTKTMILSSNKIPKIKEDHFLKLGILVIKFDENDRGHIDFNEIIKVLGEMKIDSLFVEGGSGVLGSAFDAKIVNKVYTTIAPKIVGGKDAISPVAGMGIEMMKDAIVLNKVSYDIVGRDVIITGYID